MGGGGSHAALEIPRMGTVGLELRLLRVLGVQRGGLGFRVLGVGVLGFRV